MKNRWMILVAIAGLTACGTDPASTGDPTPAPTNNAAANNGSTPDAGEEETPDMGTPQTDAGDPMKPDMRPPIDMAPPSYGEWFENFGGTNAEIIEGVASDSDGNVYVAGTFRETIVVGTETLTAVEPNDEFATDAFVASFDREGEFRWANSFGSDGSEKPFGIEVTDDGVFVVGNSQGDLFFGSSLLGHKGQGDLFAVKYDRDGNYRWSQSWGGQFTENVRDTAVNEAGDLFITGSWQGLFNAGDRTYTAETDWSAMEALVLAIDGSSGAVKWSRSFNGFLIDTGTSISADPAGNVVVGISFQYDIDIDDVELTAGESFQGVIVKLDNTGTTEWYRTYGTDGDVVEFTGIELADDGSVYATGVFSGTMNFGGDDLVNPVRGQDAVVLGLEADGTHRFSHAFGGEGFDQPLDMVARGSSFYVTGRYDGEISFGSTTLQAVGDGYDIFVAGFGNSMGDPLWARTFGGPENDQANSIAVDPWRGIYVAGYNDGGGFMFNDNMMPAASEWVDAVVFRLED